MNYCPKCGERVDDSMMFCPKCGANLVDNVPVPEYESNNNNNNNTGNNNKSGDSRKTLRYLALAFMILGCVTTLPFLIPLAWRIPMTVYYYGTITRGEKQSVGFKVCSLIFCSVVAGILMLVDEDIK